MRQRNEAVKCLFISAIPSLRFTRESMGSLIPVALSRGSESSAFCITCPIAGEAGNHYLRYSNTGWAIRFV